MNVAIEKRKNFDTTIDRETISVQNIDFFDVAIDKNFDKIIDDSIIDFDDTFFERSRTISDTNIEKSKNFDDIKNDEMIDWNNETKNKIKNEITNLTNC